MRKPLWILLAIVALAAVVYVVSFSMATRHSREMLGAAGDLAWLRSEFALSDEQAQAIAKLQADYEPRCQEMCARIAKSNERLKRLMKDSATFSAELESALKEASQTQTECRIVTMAQAFTISAHMNPQQGARYRALIAARVLPMPLTETGMGHH